jgi:hypothetical protein
LTSTTKPEDDITNSDPSSPCAITYTLENNDGSALDEGIKDLISIDEDGKISINESNYDGSDGISFRVKGFIIFNEPVYKAITILNRCSS